MCCCMLLVISPLACTFLHNDLPCLPCTTRWAKTSLVGARARILCLHNSTTSCLLVYLKLGHFMPQNMAAAWAAWRNERRYTAAKQAMRRSAMVHWAAGRLRLAFEEWREAATATAAHRDTELAGWAAANLRLSTLAKVRRLLGAGH